jgi:hypothetical protein
LIDGDLAPISEVITEGKSATGLFSYLIELLNAWPQIVDEYHLAHNPFKLSAALSKLE